MNDTQQILTFESEGSEWWVCPECDLTNTMNRVECSDCGFDPQSVDTVNEQTNSSEVSE